MVNYYNDESTLQSVAVLIDAGDDMPSSVDKINKVLQDHGLNTCKHELYRMEDRVHVKLTLYPPFHDIDVMEAIRDLAVTLGFRYLEADHNYTKTEFAFANESLRMSPLQLIKHAQDPIAYFTVWDNSVTKEQIAEYVDNAILHCMSGIDQIYEIVDAPKKRYEAEVTYRSIRFRFSEFYKLSVHDWKKAMVDINTMINSHIECDAVNFEYKICEELPHYRIKKVAK